MYTLCERLLKTQKNIFFFVFLKFNIKNKTAREFKVKNSRKRSTSKCIQLSKKKRQREATPEFQAASAAACKGRAET